MAGQRCLTFKILEDQYNTTTLGSFVDVDALHQGSGEALSYMPRALQLGFFYPGVWSASFGLKQKSIFYGIAIIESLLFVVAIISLVIWTMVKNRWVIAIPVAFSAVFIMSYAYTTPFLGALYRYRYPWWQILLCLGLAAFFDLLKSRRTGDA